MSRNERSLQDISEILAVEGEISALPSWEGGSGGSDFMRKRDQVNLIGPVPRAVCVGHGGDSH